MQIKSNIAELIKKYQAIAANAQSIDASAALTQGVNAARAVMINRIFNQGKDTFGETLGTYSKGYKYKRTKKGRQIGYKDLEFTGSLRRAIVTATIGPHKVGCFISNDFEFKLAGWLQIQVGAKRGGGEAVIFRPSEAEKEIQQDQTNKALNELYARLFNA